MGSLTSANGGILINVVRRSGPLGRGIVGFDVEDNGQGFTDENFQSFKTPDSRLKETRGGKGVGRLAWLKVFKTITIDSTYREGDQWKRRKFDFRLQDHDQIHEYDVEPETSHYRTVISFRDFHQPFDNRCSTKEGVIETRVAAHFIPMFVAGNAPKVIVIDEGLGVELESLFSSSIVDQATETLTIGEGDEAFDLTVWSMKCDRKMRFNPPAFNYAFIAGDSRSVIEYSVDEQLGLKALDNDFLYVCCASSPYLDQKVNSERTAFTLEPQEIEAVKRGIASSARNFLRPYIDRAVAKKVQTSRELIAENPQFLYMADEIGEFAESLQPNAFAKEEIFLEMSRSRFPRQKKFSGVEKSIKTGDLLKGPLTQKVDEYQTVVIVKFKRPMREDYSKGKDPVQQVLSYVQRLKTASGETDIRGRALSGIRPSTSFHCYVVADITPQLEDRIIGRFEKTPDGQGYFGYTTNPSAFVEIIPFGKVMRDARLRNAVFFQKLGITNL